MAPADHPQQGPPYQQGESVVPVATALLSSRLKGVVSWVALQPLQARGAAVAAEWRLVKLKDGLRANPHQFLCNGKH